MLNSFRLGNNVDPSGFPIAFLNIPQINPESNISLVDTSYMWEENVSSSDTNLVQSYVGTNGLTASVGSAGFLVTNVATNLSNDIQTSPLYYKHLCRFYHYSYGYNPMKQVYITDQYENILKGINYIVQAQRIAQYIYQITVITDFLNGPSVIYKVKYNRCNVDGSNIYPSWTETLSTKTLFSVGSPASNMYEYLAIGPNVNGLYQALVPPVPTISELKNSIGVSFENAPTIIYNSVSTPANEEYTAGVTVTYTIKASTSSTFCIQRNFTRTGAPSTAYLTSATADSWGSLTNFSTGTKITGIMGVTLYVHPDNVLIPNDSAYFTASRSYYYVKATSFESIYLAKPTNVTPDDDWYIKVNSGKFTRRMDSSGNVVPSGNHAGTTWQFSIPEYQSSVWDSKYNLPYKDSVSEKAVFLDKNTIQLAHTPLYIEPTGVLGNSLNPGFPPSGMISVVVNKYTLPETSLLDWDINNGTVKVAQILSNQDDIRASYIYEENFYIYEGFVGSGGLYPTTDPLPFFELNLNPSIGIGHDIYASGSIASVYLKPYSSGVIVNQDTLYHNFTGIAASGTHLLLGQISLGPNCKLSDIQIIDARNRGGGLNSDGIKNLSSVTSVQPESQFFWDVGYFDGQAVPADGTIVVRIPKTVLVSNGGAFNQDEVRQKVFKHTALGCYAIIEYI